MFYMIEPVDMVKKPPCRLLCKWFLCLIRLRIFDSY